MGDRLATIDWGRAPLGGGWELIRSTVWPQYTKVADRTGHTDRQTTVR